MRIDKKQKKDQTNMNNEETNKEYMKKPKCINKIMKRYMEKKE